jgi:glutamine amidotransferase
VRVLAISERGMRRRAGIVDYGLGNTRSVAGAVSTVGWDPVITSDPAALARVEKLILPGVGAFPDGMRRLRERGLVELLHDLVMERGVPILGVCLGAQLFAKEGFEFGHCEGLGWLDASVRKLEPGEAKLRVPHVGWNSVSLCRQSELFTDVTDEALFYFVHSFYIDCRHDDTVVGRCNYGDSFAAVVQMGHIVATQFHPEKSQQDGLTLLRNFLEKVC